MLPNRALVPLSGEVWKGGRELCEKMALYHFHKVQFIQLHYSDRFHVNLPSGSTVRHQLGATAIPKVNPLFGIKMLQK